MTPTSKASPQVIQLGMTILDRVAEFCGFEVALNAAKLLAQKIASAAIPLIVPASPTEFEAT